MFCELSEPGLIKIQGIDAKKFLQGQLTCDVNAVAEQANLGAHCNPQGRVISLFYIFQFQEAYFLCMQRSMIAIALSALKKYAVFFKTKLTDVSDQWRTLGIQNIEIMLQPDWNYLRICAGIPAIYPETSSKFLPHDLNLHHLNAISFDKGCYTGQEIIARMHYRGKLKNHLHKACVSSESSPVPGSDLYTLQGEDWKPAGMVVDVARKENNHHQLLIITNERDNLFITQNRNTPIVFES